MLSNSKENGRGISRGHWRLNKNDHGHPCTVVADQILDQISVFHQAHHAKAKQQHQFGTLACVEASSSYTYTYTYSTSACAPPFKDGRRIHCFPNTVKRNKLLAVKIVIIQPMKPARTPSPFAFLPTASVLLLIGWGGLVLLLNFSLPTLWPRWLFFFLIVSAFTGTALPIAAFLNHRFPSDPPARVQVILRQALWSGIYFSTLAWLQFGGVFTFALALLLALGFAAIEWMLRMRERSRWIP